MRSFDPGLRYAVVLTAIVALAEPATAGDTDTGPRKVTAAASPVAAPAGDRQAATRRLMRDGIVRFDAGDFQGALAAFQQAYAVSANYKIQFNIGVALAKLGRLEEARRAFEAFAATAPDADVDRLAEARRWIRELAEVSGNPTGEPPPGKTKGIESIGSAGSPDENRSQSPLTNPFPEDISKIRRLNDGGPPATSRPGAPPERDPTAIATERASHPNLTPSTRLPLSRRWWFWSAIGACVAGTVGLAVVLGQPSLPLPTTELGTKDAFR